MLLLAKLYMKLIPRKTLSLSKQAAQTWSDTFRTRASLVSRLLSLSINSRKSSRQLLFTYFFHEHFLGLIPKPNLLLSGSKHLQVGQMLLLSVIIGQREELVRRHLLTQSWQHVKDPPTSNSSTTSTSPSRRRSISSRKKFTELMVFS